MAKLTPKQKSFCDEYMKDFSICLAADRAGYTRSTAYQLLEKSHVTAYLDKKTKEAAKRNDLNIDEIIGELKSIAFDDIGNYLEYRTEKTLIGHDKVTGTPIIDYAQIIEVNESTKINTRNIAEISNTTQGFKFKLYPRDKALARLLDYLQSPGVGDKEDKTITVDIDED